MCSRVDLSNVYDDPAEAVLAYRVCATKEDDPQQEGELTSHCHLVSYELATYATKDFIEEAEAVITTFKQPGRISPVRYSEVIWEKALRCGRVYDVSRLKGLFIKEVHKSFVFQWKSTGMHTKMHLYRTYQDIRHPCQS